MQNDARQQLDFSQDEWAAIVGFSTWRETTGNRIGWYASIIGPIVLFGIYGACKGEITAVGLAFVCLLAYCIWRVRLELQYLPVYRSICSKIVAFKSSQEPLTGPEILAEEPQSPT